MGKKGLQSKEDKQLAFQEEEKNLSAVEDRIHEIISEKRKVVKAYDTQIQAITIVDDSDRQQRIRLMEQRNLQKEYLEDYSSYVDSPYFGHMDMSDDEADYSFFVGTKGLTNEGKTIILDWRSQMGRTFYDKQKTSYVVEGKKYDLSLRRATDIKKGKLISVNTEYDSVNVSLDGKVIDPFLLSVLADKRRNRKLTNIIRTIQQNQNEIIGKPVDENYIVQGCAGSGKTMILLHRLSYIAFNYPKTDFARVCIITPNESFNLQIDDLSRELGLDKIRKYTMESLYSGLINSRSRIDTDVSNGSRVQKVSVNGKEIISEKLLRDDMLAYLYSDEFFNDVVKWYTDLEKALLPQINGDVYAALQRNQIAIEKPKHLRFREVSILRGAMDPLIDEHIQAEKSISEKEKELEISREKMLNLQLQVQDGNKNLDDQQQALRNTINADLITLQKESALETTSIDQLKKDVEVKLTEKNVLLVEISESERLTALLNLSPEEIIQSESLLTGIEVDNKAECLELYNRIQLLQSQLQKVAAYNFGKRRRLTNEIADLENELKEIVNNNLQRARVIDAEKTDSLKKQLSGIENELQMMQTILGQKSNEQRQRKAKIDVYQILYDLFSTQSFPDLKRNLSPDDYDLCEDLIATYEKALEKHGILQRNLVTAKAKESRLIEEINTAQNKLLDLEDYNQLIEARTKLNAMDISNLRAELRAKIQAIYERHGQVYSGEVKYRHQLYLLLLLCTMYYGPASNAGYYLNIDEAQDLAPMELRLLRGVLGKKTVFNLYGDVNQAIYNYKGIQDWEDVMSIVPSSLYVLNENYRNTVEITDYCNHVFDAEVTAIGLHGAPVKELDFRESIQEIDNLFRTVRPLPRIAVIYKNGLKIIREKIDAVIKSKHVFNRIEKSSISVITTEEAKGLEFDAVLVIKNNMTINEEYISYTRALDNLIITALPSDN